MVYICTNDQTSLTLISARGRCDPVVVSDGSELELDWFSLLWSNLYAIVMQTSTVMTNIRKIIIATEITIIVVWLKEITAGPTKW